MPRFISTIAAALAFSASALIFADTAETAPATSTAPASQPATKPDRPAHKRKDPLTIQGKAINDSYIIMFNANVSAKDEVARLEKELNFKASHIYDAIGGFAAKLPAATAEKLRWEINIKLIEHDGVATTNGGGMGAN
jgi:hypothetical protein